MKILLLEDDLDLCRSIQNVLIKNGYTVDVCNDGETAMLYALNTDCGYELAIVDRMLPVIDGLTIIKAMRRKGIQIPVIIITGMSAIDDRIDGLDGGADDYLVKPFHIKELMARIRALTRRSKDTQNLEFLSYADLQFDRENRRLLCNGHELDLSAKETDLICVCGDLGAAYMGLQLLEREKTVFEQQRRENRRTGNHAENDMVKIYNQKSGQTHQKPI